MSRPIRPGMPALLAGVWLVLAAGELAAQATQRYPELDRSHAEAMELAYSSAPGSLERAVWSHGHVAFLRPADDVERFECLRTQAQLLKAVGYQDGARFYLELAARQAEEHGDAYGAAVTYIDAGALALEMKDASHAWEYAQRATALASTGRMDAGQRREVRDRLGIR